MSPGQRKSLSGLTGSFVFYGSHEVGAEDFAFRIVLNRDIFADEVIRRRTVAVMAQTGGLAGGGDISLSPALP